MQIKALPTQKSEFSQANKCNLTQILLFLPQKRNHHKTEKRNAAQTLLTDNKILVTIQ